MVELTLSQINGRFKLLEKPAALPGKCAVCGAVDRPVIDFGMDLDVYGAVYICVDDMTAAAQILGMVDGDKLTRAELVQRNHADQLETAGEVINEFRAAFVEFCDSYTRRISAVSDPTAVSDDPVPTEEPTELVEDSDGTTGEDESVTFQVLNPARYERSVGLSSGSGYGSDLFPGL